jgi:hypothetical protein
MKKPKQHVNKTTKFTSNLRHGRGADTYGINYTRLKVGDYAAIHVAPRDKPQNVRALLASRLSAGRRNKAFACGKRFSTRTVGRTVMVFRVK